MKMYLKCTILYCRLLFTVRVLPLYLLLAAPPHVADERFSQLQHDPKMISGVFQCDSAVHLCHLGYHVVAVPMILVGSFNVQLVVVRRSRIGFDVFASSFLCFGIIFRPSQRYLLRSRVTRHCEITPRAPRPFWSEATSQLHFSIKLRENSQDEMQCSVQSGAVCGSRSKSLASFEFRP